jgi:hypothetical protein
MGCGTGPDHLHARIPVLSFRRVGYPVGNKEAAMNLSENARALLHRRAGNETGTRTVVI